MLTQGEWSPNETGLLVSLIQPGNTVLDVGANVGNMTLAMAAAVGEGGLVVSFEPQLYCYSCLVANVALNSLIHRVQCLQAAAGSAPGQIEVPILDPMKTVTNFGGVSLIDQHTTATAAVPLVTIDAIGLQNCHLIKVDIEGMEPQALAGASATIEKFRPIIWTECLEIRNTRPELIKFFADLNYDAWWVFTDIYSPRNIRLNTRNLYQLADGSIMQDNNVIAVPKEKQPPAWTANLTKFE